MWYDLDIPTEIKNKDSDFIAFTVETKTNSTTCDFIACYGSWMTRLPDCTFTCMPSAPLATNVTGHWMTATADMKAPRVSILPGDIFMRWVDLCKEHNLCIREARAWRDGDKNYFYLPGRSKHRHEIYTSLCIHRWSENTALIPYTVVKLLELKPHIHFYQALHYAMAKYLYITNHSFHTIGSAHNIYGRKATCDLLDGLVMAYFFTKNKQDQSISDQQNQTIQTTMAITLFKTSLQIKPLALNTLPDILLDDWICLYSMKKPDAREITRYFNSVLTQKAA